MKKMLAFLLLALVLGTGAAEATRYIPDATADAASRLPRVAETDTAVADSRCFHLLQSEDLFLLAACSVADETEAGPLKKFLTFDQLFHRLRRIAVSRILPGDQGSPRVPLVVEKQERIGLRCIADRRDRVGRNAPRFYGIFQRVRKQPFETRRWQLEYAAFGRIAEGAKPRCRSGAIALPPL